MGGGETNDPVIRGDLHAHHPGLKPLVIMDCRPFEKHSMLVLIFHAGEAAGNVLKQLRHHAEAFERVVCFVHDPRQLGMTVQINRFYVDVRRGQPFEKLDRSGRQEYPGKGQGHEV